MDHEDLVSEITQVEKMATTERLKHAKKRRQQQLKKFAQYEKQLEKEQNKKSKNKNNANKRLKKASHNRHIVFVNNVMLLEAAARNDVQEVRELLKQGVSADVTNEDGLTALHQCCIDDLEEMLKVLLEFKANVNAQDSELWTPLHAAATCGHIHLCRILIENGAELLSVNADGNMPYDICEDDVTLDFIEGEMAKRGVTQDEIDNTRLSTEHKMLVDLQNMANNGEDLEYRGRVGETPLHIAAANGYAQVTEFLMNQHVSVDIEDEDSWQPIHAAACWGHLPVLEILVQHGADLQAKTRNGETPFDICEDLEMKERMMELKNEIETKGIVNKRNLVRRRSTNTRSSVVSNSSTSLYNSNTSLVEKGNLSASVRRTSMREKAAISWKEALEEGRRLRDSFSSNDGEDLGLENEETGVRIEDVKMKFENPPANRLKEQQQQQKQQQKESPRETENKPKPGSSIREATDIFAPAAGTLPHQPKTDKNPPPQNIKTTAPPPPANMSSASTAKKDDSKAKGDASSNLKAAGVAKAAAPQSPMVIKDLDKPPMNKSRDPVNKPRDSSKPPPPQAIVKPTPQQRPKPVEEPKPAPPKAVVSASKPPPPSAKPSQSPAASRKQERASSPVRKTSDSNSVDSTPASGNQRAGAAVAPTHGTLSDLKKQRALALQEKLHNSLRFKDTDSLNEQIAGHHENNVNGEKAIDNKDTNQPQTEQQNGKVKQNNNKYYMPPERTNSSTKYKFTDTQVLGDNDTQTSCCIIQ